MDGPPRWPRHWRNPTARAKAAEVIRLDTKGFQRTEIARRTGIGEENCWQWKSGSVIG
jgi:hypothetical protein